MNYFEFMRPCYVKVKENLFRLFWYFSLYILQTYFIMQLNVIMAKRRVGIVGYGSLGQYLTEKVRTSANFELVFVWNRSIDKITDIEDDLKLNKLEDIPHRKVDIIVEVAHPDITKQYAEMFFQNADYLIGSPTALADEETFRTVKELCLRYKRSAYVPAGAFWGGEDIRKMADADTLTGLTVTMSKHPTAFRLNTPLKEINDTVKDDPVVLYEGPVKQLCSLAPNNVNTMAAACIAGHNLGFENVTGRLVSDPRLADWHIVEAEIRGMNGFTVNCVRKNPAKFGAVSGAATYISFWSTLQNAHGKHPGVHLC